MKLFLFSLGLSLNLFGAEYRLARIESNVDKNVTEFFYDETAEGHVNSFRFVTTKPTGQISTDESFPIERVIRNGIVLTMDGHPVIKVFVEKFTPEVGGGIKLDHLYNGISGTRRVQRLSIKRFPERFWLQNLDGVRINTFLVRGNYSRFFGLIGIRDILYSWKEEVLLESPAD